MLISAQWRIWLTCYCCLFRALFALKGRKMTLPSHNAFGHKFESPVGHKNLSIRSTGRSSSNCSSCSLGRLTPELYRNVSPKSSVENDVKTRVNMPGKIQFSLEYCYQTEKLKVFVQSASELALTKQSCGGNVMNSQVEVNLIPFEQNGKVKNLSRVQRQTVNPIFDELFEFPIRFHNLVDRMLIINVVANQPKSNKLSPVGYFIVRDIEIYNLHKMSTFSELLISPQQVGKWMDHVWNEPIELKLLVSARRLQG